MIFMSNRLKLLRDLAGLTQEQLAEKLGTTKQTVGRLEKSQRRLDEDWVFRIVDVLGCHPGEIWQELPRVSMTAEHEAIIRHYEGLSESGQKAFQTIIAATAELDRSSNGQSGSGG